MQEHVSQEGLLPYLYIHDSLPLAEALLDNSWEDRHLPDIVFDGRKYTVSAYDLNHHYVACSTKFCPIFNLKFKSSDGQAHVAGCGPVGVR